MGFADLRSLARRVGGGFLVNGLVTSGMLAAIPATQSATQPSHADAPLEFPSLKEALLAKEAPLDQELAARIMKKQEAAPTPQIELGIDVRVIERWLYTQAAMAEPASEAQIEALLRTADLSDAIGLMEADLKPDWKPTHAQLDAMNRLHKLTFELPDFKEGSQLDDVMRKVGSDLVLVSNPTPIDPKSLPAMRPSRVRFESDDTAKPTTQSLRSIADLQAEVTRAAISLPLRRQLLAMVKSAATAEPKDAAALHQALSDGVDLARGLSSTTAFSAQAKEQIESQLAEGLALVSDPRTRLAGEDRIATLNEYRLVMNRIAKTKLPPDMRNSLEPAFGYAQTHAAEGTRVLNLIGDFAQVVSKADALPAKENPIANLRSATNEVAKQYSAARSAFVSAANSLGTNGSTTPGLEDKLSDLRELADLYTVLATMQQTYEALNAYKPRPYGMIEQRAGRAATVAASMVRSGLRSDGVKFLMDLNRLARLSDAISSRSLADIPPAVMAKYAGVSTEAFSAKVKLLMADLINSAAAGQEPDRRKIDRLNAVDQLVTALHDAAVFEQSLETAASLQKWVDWKLNTDQIHALAQPYQQLVNDAFSALVTDAPGDGLNRFLKMRESEAPVIQFMQRDARAAGACEAMPGGLQGDLSRLMTPMHNQPFALERYESFAMMAWSIFSESDPAAAAAALSAAMRRLQRE